MNNQERCLVVVFYSINKGDQNMDITLYYSESCGYCRRFVRTLEAINEEREQVTLVKIRHQPEIHGEVKFIPTVIIAYKGQELGRFSSALAKKTIDLWLDQLVNYIADHLQK
jgi:thioredoxin-like negative regulator of GroEL